MLCSLQTVHINQGAFEVPAGLWDPWSALHIVLSSLKWVLGERQAICRAGAHVTPAVVRTACLREAPISITDGQRQLNKRRVVVRQVQGDRSRSQRLGAAMGERAARRSRGTGSMGQSGKVGANTLTGVWGGRAAEFQGAHEMVGQRQGGGGAWWVRG